jgi:hypothetical protein
MLKFLDGTNPGKQTKGVVGCLYLLSIGLLGKSRTYSWSFRYKKLVTYECLGIIFLDPIQRSLLTSVLALFCSLKNNVGFVNFSTSFAEAAVRAFDNLSLELQRSAKDDNFVEKLEEFLKIMDNNDVDEEGFYKNLEFEHQDEDSAYSCYL